MAGVTMPKISAPKPPPTIMTILRATFSDPAILAWSMHDAAGEQLKTGVIEPSRSDPLVELHYLELRSGVARVEFTITPAQPITPSERAYATAAGWHLL